MSKSDFSSPSSKKKFAFLNFVKKSPIDIVSSIPILVAVVSVVLWVILKGCFWPGVPQVYNHLVLALASLIAASTGLIYVARKEMPGPMAGKVIRGNCAVASGILLIAFFGIFGLLGLILALLGL